MKENAITRIESGSSPIVKSLNFSDLIGEFLDSQDIRPVSKEVYRKGLERLLTWLASNGIRQPDRKAILQFKVYLQELGLSANTVNSYLIGVRRFFAFLESSRLYPDIAKTIKGMKQPRGNLKETPTLSQAHEILSRIETESITGKRNFAIINLMLRTGMRTIEIVRANVEDLRQQGGEALLFVHGKGRDSKDDFVLLTDKSLFPILDYLKARGKAEPGDPLFISHSDRNSGGRLTTRTINGISKFFLREIGIDKKGFSAHSFRHFAITAAIRAGAPVEQTQAMARHTSIQTTMGYYHNLDRIEKAAERFIDF